MGTNLINKILLVWQEKEILSDHRWIKSEEKGYQLDLHEVVLDWALKPNYHDSPAARFRDYFFEHKEEVMACCKKHCGENTSYCSAKVDECPLSPKEIHEVLEDWPENTPPYNA